MIETTVLDYLSDKLDVPVYMEEPEKPPKQYVIIEKTGGGRKNYINSAMLALQSYGETLLQAAELNEQVKDAMEDIVELDSISQAELNTDYNFTDTQTKRYRYQAVYDLVFF